MFVIPGAPQGKGRPRFNSKTKQTYTPDKTRIYEDHVRWCFRTSKDFYKLEGPIKATITAYFKIPKSASKKTKEAMLNGEILPVTKPDGDNIVKIVLDSLNEIAYHDDSSVVELHFFKYYGEEPRVEVALERVDYND